MSPPLRWALLAALLTACQRQATARPSAATTHVLPATGLVLALDGPAQVRAAARGDVLTLRPGARSPVELSATLVPAPPPLVSPQALTTVGGLEVRYVVEHHDGGSGGAEATVSGVARTRRGFVALRCHAQSELGAPEAPCLSLLGRLRAQ